VPRLGVLVFQGDFEKHLLLLRRMGVSAVEVRRPDELDQIDGLIIPGGESTTIGMLMERFGLLTGVTERAKTGLAVMGTCAGAILLATDILASTQPRLNLIDMTIERNAYGRQIESFETELAVSPLLQSQERSAGEPEEALRGVFIRAPVIRRAGENTRILASYEGNPVVVTHGRHLACTFHPELAGDERVHRYFVRMLERSTIKK